MLDVSTLDSERHHADDFAAVQELFHRNGWTDGLPIVPPTPDAVARALDYTGLPASHLVGVEPVRGRAVTAEKVAVNAVMAGCLPQHLGVVIAAVTAMLQPEFLLHGATASTGGCAVMVVVNGPARHELAMSSSFNVLGSSDRSSSCVGRAVRLVLGNVFDVRPGEVDRSTLGHPGKISWCVAEDEEQSPWTSLAEERIGDPHASAVTVFAAMAPRQIMNEWTTDPNDIVDTFAAEMRANLAHYSIWGGNYAIVVPPQLRSHFAGAGWTKADIQQAVYERARITRGTWADVGKASVVGDEPDREYAALTAPEDLLVIAAGGPAGGFGAVIPPWLGTKSRAVTVAVGACVDC